MFGIADELLERSGREALMGLPDIQSPMDIAAMIWNMKDFSIALMEEPKAVRELSVDEIGSVSEEVFVDLFMNELCELSLRFGGIGIHCCASARHQWENLAALPGLKLINSARQSQDASYRIEHVSAQWHGIPEAETPENDL